MKHLVFQNFWFEILGISIEILGFSFEILVISKICGNRIPYVLVEISLVIKFIFDNKSYLITILCDVSANASYSMLKFS